MADVANHGEAGPDAPTLASLQAELEAARQREGELRSAVSALSILLGGVVGVLERSGLPGTADADDFLFSGAADAARAIRDRAAQEAGALAGTATWHFSPEAFRATVALVREVARAVERGAT